MKFYTLTMFLTLLATPAFAKNLNIAECSDSIGYSYYPKRDLVVINGDNSGWTEDRISGGNINLVINESGRLDFISRDTMDEKSAVSHGADINVIIADDEYAFLTTKFPSGVFNTHTFQKLSDGKYNVMWSQMVPLKGLPKMASYVAECNYLNLKPLLNLLTNKQL